MRLALLIIGMIVKIPTAREAGSGTVLKNLSTYQPSRSCVAVHLHFCVGCDRFTAPTPIRSWNVTAQIAL
ncbi:MAG: hypothetical protein ACKN81_07965, partial [Pirellulaceae bacterium]